jgi:hypothetical protein
MPTLLEYINQLQREHRYRIKMAFQPTDQQLEVLERHMKKYDALEVGRPQKLMLQAVPMDFPQLGGHEIVIVDVVTRLPVSMPTLEAELCNLLWVNMGALKVFGRDEPVEKQIESACDEDGEYTVKTGTDYTSEEANPVKADNAAGPKYNQDLLKDLDKVNSERKKNITQGVGKVTNGPTYEEPADGKTSPIGTKQVKIPSPFDKGSRK